MKIGFSFGRCVRDLVKGDVKMEDVMCVISRTYITKLEQIAPIVGEYLYRPGYLYGLDRDACMQVGQELFSSGKLLQPRVDGVHPMQVPDEYVWMDLFPTKVGVQSEAVTSAWDQYRMLLNLTELVPECENVDLGHYNRVSASESEATPEQLEKEKRMLDLLLNSI